MVRKPMSVRRALPAILALCVATAAGDAAAAPREPFTATGAMRHGIYQYADYPARGVARGIVHASDIHVSCEAIPKVGERRPCTGSFRLSRGSHTATYRLTSRASTFRNTRHSIMYTVAATADRALPGLPRSTGSFSGFVSDHSGKP
ncbi:MAG TPA: hypothetical protein VHB30_08185 [Solirubrobacteraceae bacterium]|nr:hypothetical protein [Solirubrobacteraceae bacterium]